MFVHANSTKRSQQRYKPIQRTTNTPMKPYLFAS